MREVTKDELYRFVGPQDVIVELTGQWPYTSTFHPRGSRATVAKIVPEQVAGVWPDRERYYVQDTAL